MTDPGLTFRLRQRSRRAGLAVGISMALTIGVCIVSFSWIYAQVDPYLRDFTGQQGIEQPRPTATATADEAAQVAATDEADEPPEEEPEQEPTAEPTPTREPSPTPTPTPDVFTATHISNPNSRTNFRPEPSLDNDPVAILEAGTPLQYLGEDATGDDGLRWMRFRTEDGLEGWMREDAVQPI